MDCIILIAFPLQKLLYKHVSVLRVHCLSYYTHDKISKLPRFKQTLFITAQTGLYKISKHEILGSLDLCLTMYDIYFMYPFEVLHTTPSQLCIWMNKLMNDCNTNYVLWRFPSKMWMMIFTLAK